MPTEAEWECAAGEGTATPRWTGDVTYVGDGHNAISPELDEIAWWAGSAMGRTHAVRSKPPNPWGLHGVIGNVWEHCNDSYAEDYGGIEDPDVAVVDPSGPAQSRGCREPDQGGCRVNRGGGWPDPGYALRVAFRGTPPTTERNHDAGLRPARTAVP